MSAETVNSHPLLRRLHQALTSCSTSIKSEDFKQSDESIAELVEFLTSIADNAVSEPDNKLLADNALVIVTDILRYFNSPSLQQAVVDVLSFELPKAVARLACVSQICFEIADSVINRFIEICNPRDLLPILSEALDSPYMNFKVPGYYAPLVSGVAKVVILIQRRQFEQVKEAVPVVVNVLKTVLSESDEEETHYEELLERSVEVASSIQLLCVKLEGKVNEKLRALLGLYVLQTMAFVSFGTNFKVPRRFTLVKRLSGFLQYSNLSYIGLITGCDVDTISTTLAGDFENDGRNCFSYTKHGASLAVIWGYKANEIAEASGEDLAKVITELSSNQTKRWQALGMLRYMLTCFNLSWELKKQAIDFLLGIVDGKMSPECDNEHMDYSSYMPTLFSALQAVEMVIMYAPDPMIKKNAFDVFKKVLADIPSSLRFDTLMALINNSDSSSMVAILIDCVRNEMRMERCQQITTTDQVLQAENNANQSNSFWNAGILELVALVLRPPRGGPPSLPEFGDAVLSALNLYRYVLMTESIGVHFISLRNVDMLDYLTSTMFLVQCHYANCGFSEINLTALKVLSIALSFPDGNSNRTGVLSQANLQKAYNEWLLPLRTLVTGIMAENKKESGDFDLDIVCGLNPVELVLYRCIELVEEKLQKNT